MHDRSILESVVGHGMPKSKPLATSEVFLSASLKPKCLCARRQLALRVRLASEFLNQVDAWEGPGSH